MVQPRERIGKSGCGEKVEEGGRVLGSVTVCERGIGDKGKRKLI